MKLTAVLLTIACMHVYANGLTQKVSFTGKNVSVEQVFAAIEKQTGYVVFFDYASLGGVKEVSVSVKDASITELLRACFKDAAMDFTIQGKNILISRKEKVAELATAYTPPPVPDIRGKVLDSLGNPLVGATVTIKGTKKAVQTNDEGIFTIKDTNPDVLLVVSFTGFESQVLALPNKQGRPFFVILKASFNPLDETIVQAYGTTSKRFNVGSIAKVGREEIQSQPIFNPLSALEGRVPGLLVTTQNGVAGGMIKMQIRGQNTLGAQPKSVSMMTPDNPLFIIDGIPFAPQNNSFTTTNNILYNTSGNYGGGLSPFANINPADIESIEVLKDADATAIYGARGANGVILITTRKAAAGKASLSGSVSTGFNRAGRTMKLMNTEQFLQMRKQALANDNMQPNLVAGSNGYAPDLLLFDNAKYTNQMDELFGGTASTLSANMYFSGGSNSNTFSLSAGYDKQTNLYPGNYAATRFSINSNLHHSSNDRRFSADFSAGYSYGLNNLPGSPSISQALELAPNFPDLKRADGSLAWDYNGTPFSNIIPGFINPYSYLLQTSNVGSHYMTMNLALSYRLLPGLTFKTNMGYNLFTGNEYWTFPILSQNPYLPFTRTGSAQKRDTRNYVWNIEPQLNYNKKIGRGKLDVLAGMTFQKMMSSGTSLFGMGYVNDLLLNSITAAGTIQVQEDFSPYKYNAVFGRINYVHNNKYILNFSGRIDGSSRFNINRRWARFGSVGGGWIFSEEAVVKKALPVLSFGKLRGSYGITGDDGVGNYLYYSNWKTAGTLYLYNGSQGYTPLNPENWDYSWSSNKKLDLGMDLGLFNDKLLLNVTWYRNLSYNQLIQYQLPTQTGFTNVTQNFQAVVENKGWEFSATGTPVKSKNFTWKTAANISLPKNKLVDFPGLASSTYGNIFTLGMSTGTVKGYSYAGVNDTTGVYQFKTASGGKAYFPSPSADNKFILGDVNPKYYGGFRNTFTYKKLQVEMFVEFRKQWGPTFLKTMNGTPGYMTNMPVEFLDSWTKTGDKTTYQRLTQTYSSAASAMGYLRMSDFVYGDASYIRFKTLGVNYTLDGAWLRKIKVISCRLAVSAANLFTITGYKGIDPETQSYYTLPPSKTFNTSLQFNF
ncbi:TonB-linked SusC/RagA family outer membrane protein [Filimonas zeae]|uniref:SusC/RagA family TonB-linked outer membrane protein n=1 Tax=Filimonas zeae TaxID=1737353 RepID=A0A917MXN1_9BACT|nr:SusC/RagA family TonB-linked outer membrane protein [Filimonas zeae]MDR6338695.1 TonB-linked SusC/RagA family outer membrane protein [Filimonas zeae]GGH67020.1 SusC/RagA family TonB-linked outer membrane protein [Filimonas zeae]